MNYNDEAEHDHPDPYVIRANKRRIYKGNYRDTPLTDEEKQHLSWLEYLITSILYTLSKPCSSYIRTTYTQKLKDYEKQLEDYRKEIGYENF